MSQYAAIQAELLAGRFGRPETSGEFVPAPRPMVRVSPISTAVRKPQRRMPNPPRARAEAAPSRDARVEASRLGHRQTAMDAVRMSVAEFYGVEVSEMCGPSRAELVLRPRQVAMYLVRELTGLSLPTIGGQYGGRDHSTVLHAIGQVERRLAGEPYLAAEMAMIREMVAERMGAAKANADVLSLLEDAELGRRADRPGIER